MKSVLVRICFGILATALIAADNWPQFRGPQALGTTDDTSLPDTWSTTKNVAWKTDIPGRGWSSPITWGDRVFLTAVVNEGKEEATKKGLYFGGERTAPTTPHRWTVYCLDLDTGKIAWQRVAHRGIPTTGHHVKNTFASETPVTDGERVYAYFGNLGVFCYDLDGKEVWSKKLGSYKTRLGWGTAASPCLYRDRLFIVNDNEEKSFLVALDAKTGKEMWRVERAEKSNWATPYVWENELRTEIVTSGRNKVRSYDLDGKLLWELGGMSSIVIPTPFAKSGLLYVCSGYVLDGNRPIYAIRPGASGDISLKEGQKDGKYIAWCQKTAGPYNPTPVIAGDLLYVLYDRGFLACYDARTGKEVYGRQRLGSASAFTASPWAYGGRVFCLSEDGDTHVVEGGPNFKLVGKNSLDDTCLATPALVRGRLLIRTERSLYCLRKGMTSSSPR